MSRDALTEWRAVLAKIDKCHWPGPRPFPLRTPPRFLVGRDDDRTKFLNKVNHHRLIFLTGASGVGKTSLLHAGLVPKLEADGYLVVVCREWGGSSNQPAAQFLAAKVHAALGTLGRLRRPDSEDVYSNDPQIFYQLARDYGDRVVLLLDQFEELIRYSPGLRAKMYDLLATINQRLKVKVVISFRDEYLLQLRPLQKRATPFSTDEYVLEEIDDAMAIDVINAANESDSQSWIAADAAYEIAALWKEARSSEDRGEDAVFDPFFQVGLLHLQALLYALEAAARHRQVTNEIFAEFRGDMSAAALFAGGLNASIDIKLERCRAASAKLDPYLVEGAEQALARSVRHLSSGGFKLVREAHELAEATLGAEKGNLLSRMPVRPQPEAQRVRALLYTLLDGVVTGDEDGQSDAPVVDLLAAPLDAVALAADRDLPADADAAARWASLQCAELDGLADPKFATCGPMSRMAPAAVLAEEFRRFAFGLAWLESTDLIRINAPGISGLMVSLIHDGFGRALQLWADHRLEGPRGALHALTAPTGADFFWTADTRDSTLLRGKPDEPRVVANLRWRGAGIRAELSHVVFVNCDFRGAYFYDSNFEGLTFVNCWLDGAMFDRCTLVGNLGGASAFHAARGLTRSPRFGVVGMASSEVAAIAHYRGLARVTQPVLVSGPPDEPAIPAEANAADEIWTVTPPAGGVAIYGGRLSSFVVRSCVGSIAFRNVTGSGMQVVEESEGHYEFSGSALRHVRFSPSSPRKLEIVVVESTLIQMWLGENLRGSFSAQGCDLFQITNRAPAGLFAARATESRIRGLGRFDDSAGCERLTDEQLENDPDLLEATLAMDDVTLVPTVADPLR